MIFFFFFFNDTATTEIYTLSLHDALPISHLRTAGTLQDRRHTRTALRRPARRDRKSTRLNSSHSQISYAVFCLKKKKKKKQSTNTAKPPYKARHKIHVHDWQTSNCTDAPR